MMCWRTLGILVFATLFLAVDVAGLVTLIAFRTGRPEPDLLEPAFSYGVALICGDYIGLVSAIDVLAGRGSVCCFGSRVLRNGACLFRFQAVWGLIISVLFTAYLCWLIYVAYAPQWCGVAGFRSADMFMAAYCRDAIAEGGMAVGVQTRAGDVPHQEGRALDDGQPAWWECHPQFHGGPFSPEPLLADRR
jgi:hypothetical protein